VSPVQEPDFRSEAFLRAHIAGTMAFYHPRAIDPRGGFYHYFRDDGTVYDTAHRHLVSSTRFVFNYARAAREFTADAALSAEYLAAARHGLRYLREQHREAQSGGYVWTLRAGVPEEIEQVVAVAMQKDPARRYASGLDFAAELTRVHQKLRQQYSRMDQQEQFALLRRLKFFHDFSHAEIHEVMRASHWQDYASGEEIVKEGEMDDRFYIIVSGNCAVESHGQTTGMLSVGECFGETSYVPGAKRTATIRAADAVTALKVSSTLLEQVSASCQLRFNRMFLRSLISRLQNADRPAPAE